MKQVSIEFQQLPLLFHTAFMFGLLSFCIFCTYKCLLSRCSNPKLQAVYGPKIYPVVGSLLSLWKKRGNGLLLEWYARMLAKSPTQTIEGVRTLVTKNPTNIEHILKTQFDNYPKGESMRLYLPVPFDSKHALHEDLLPDGTFVGKGNRVTYQPYAMGRMETLQGADCLQYDDEGGVPQRPVQVCSVPIRRSSLVSGQRNDVYSDEIHRSLRHFKVQVASTPCKSKMRFHFDCTDG